MPSFEDLFAPNMEYNYFSLAHQHPFEGQNSYFSLVNAGWLADCSLLVYLTDEAEVRMRLTRDGGFTEVTFIGFDRPGAQCFIARRNEGTIVCFRGTEVSEWQDLVADAEFVLAPDPDSSHGANVHGGFLRSLSTIWDEIEANLSGGDVWFTGHSLGAGLATLAADRYPNVHPLYTFGSPRVGDKKFHKEFRGNAYRFVNNNDGVTLVPPVPYCHLGDFKYLDEAGCLIDDPRLWQRVKESLTGHMHRIVDVQNEFLKGDFDTVPLDQLADHSPTTYAKHLWAIIADTR